MKQRPIGKQQRGCLEALVRHGSYPGSWVWSSHSLTARILDSLVKRGLVERVERAPIHPDTGRPFYSYRPTDAGREAIR